jgi:hypothetical protein
MPTIDQLCAVKNLSVSDLLAIYSAQNGDARKLSLGNLIAFLQTQLVQTDNKTTFYAAPSATGFTVTLTDSNASLWLILTPVADYAAGTIVLPSLGNSVDKQEILVNSTHAVTTLTINGNGSTVTGAPTTLAANGSFRLRFDDVTNTWYKV